MLSSTGDKNFKLQILELTPIQQKLVNALGTSTWADIIQRAVSNVGLG